MNILRDKFGVQKCTSLFEVPEQGKHLILDGDGLAYTAAAGAAKLETALRRYEQQVLSWMFLTRCSTASVHITPRDCAKANRSQLQTVLQYQANRAGKVKPALLEPLRDVLQEHFSTNPQITLFRSWEYEADDSMVMEHYLNRDAILWSPDKDLRVTPFPFWEEKLGNAEALTNRFGFLREEYTEAGAFKCSGRGTKFFLAQMLMGDTADNVKGITKYKGKLCGAKLAFNVLNECTTEHEAVNLVLDAYAWNCQNPLPEAYALWLLRTPNDTAIKFFESCGLTRSNQELITFYKDKIYETLSEEGRAV